MFLKHPVYRYKMTTIHRLTVNRTNGCSFTRQLQTCPNKAFFIVFLTIFNTEVLEDMFVCL
jgi:hypothetical protein